MNRVFLTCLLSFWVAYFAARAWSAIGVDGMPALGDAAVTAAGLAGFGDQTAGWLVRCYAAVMLCISGLFLFAALLFGFGNEADRTESRAFAEGGTSVALVAATLLFAFGTASGLPAPSESAIWLVLPGLLLTLLAFQPASQAVDSHAAAEPMPAPDLIACLAADNARSAAFDVVLADLPSGGRPPR